MVMENAILKHSPELTAEQGQKLLALARTTIAERLGLPAAPTPVLDDPVYQEQRGTFVTLKTGGQLRGCIGSLQGTEAINAGIRRNAISAAFNDMRFSPLTTEEFDKIHIDISILTKPRTLEYKDAEDLLAKLRVDIDGVIIRKNSTSATFLPQVWKQLPDARSFLSRLCHKAGLPENLWQTSPLEVQTYQVQYFEE